MKETKRLTLCAVLISMALALSYMERMIPLQLLIPLPGIKLGLANIVSIVALYLLGRRSAYIILIIRCLLGSMFGGGVSGLLFSLTGGIMSVTMMILSRKVPFFSIYGVSVLGAAAHNMGQILAAIVLMKTIYVVGYLPYLLLVALVTGLATASVSSGVLKVLLSLKKDNYDRL